MSDKTKQIVFTITLLTCLGSQANATTWDYAGIIAGCVPQFCAIVPMANDDPVEGFITIGAGMNESFTLPDNFDNFDLDVNEGTASHIEAGPTETTLTGFGSTDANGDILNGMLLGVFHKDTNLGEFDGYVEINLVTGDATIKILGDVFVASVTGTWTRRSGQPDAAPVAVAGPDQAIRAGDTAFLDGGSSFDDNTANATLGFDWSFAVRPSGSTATLIEAGTVTPSFVSDVAGTYTVRLVVTDSIGQPSAPDFVEISTENLAPSASAGDDQLVIVGETILLDGTSSADPEGDALSYDWSLITVPVGSIASLSGADSSSPSFISDVEGQYQASLEVSDLLGPGSPDTVTITAVSPEQFAEVQIVETADLLDSLTVDEVTTAGNQEAMTNFLSQAAQAAQAENLAKAIKKLQDAIERTDGCVLRGSPDSSGAGRDWITDCSAQAEAYGLLTAALEAISP